MSNWELPKHLLSIYLSIDKTMTTMYTLYKYDSKEINRQIKLFDLYLTISVEM